MSGQRIQELERLLKLQGTLISVPLRRIDPLWNPLRGNPRFKKLVEGS